jgi:DNA repair exonuclease SbcCD ATPase subunit
LYRQDDELLGIKMVKIKTMKTTDTKNKTGNGTKTATAQLADLNAQIEALKQQKTSLAEPMKARHAELRSELLQVETEIRELDSSWKPASLRPKAEEKISEFITANGPMTVEAIVQAVGKPPQFVPLVTLLFWAVNIPAARKI